METFTNLTAALRNTTLSIFNPPLSAENIRPDAAVERKHNGPLSPTGDDVVAVKKLFLESRKLPLELIDSIVDMAEYWPHTRSVFRREKGDNNSENPLYVKSGDEGENRLLLRTPPIGFIPLREWTHTMSNPQPTIWKTITDVGPELEGTGKYIWSLEDAPLLSNCKPGEDGDDELAKKVLNELGTDAATRGATCRKIVFTIRSHDQGWGGSAADKGTYRGSFTWFDVGKERLVAKREDDDAQHPIVLTTRQILPTIDGSGDVVFPLMGDDMCLQKNLTAVNTFQEHTITWSAEDNVNPESPEGEDLQDQGRGKATMNGEFVRNLKVGDSITVWAKARFPGWCNIITDVKVDVYWAV